MSNKVVPFDGPEGLSAEEEAALADEFKAKREKLKHAPIFLEDDEMYKKWSGPMILGPFTLALYSVIIIVSGEITLNTAVGTCGYNLDCKLFMFIS